MIQIGPEGKLDFSKIPQGPGVYLYRDSAGEIIYIGKAINLNKRVRSYFSLKPDAPVKTRHLVAKISSCEWIVVNSEVEALLLENQLIKKNTPRYNIDLKDAKTFAYIKLTSGSFPRILSTRKVTKEGTYFGPYTSGYQRIQLLRAAVSIFKIRTCATMPKRECLNHHIGLCSAPCVGKITKEAYQASVEKAKSFLKGNVSEVKSHLSSVMDRASKELKFEQALEAKEQLLAVSQLFDPQVIERQQRYDQDVIALVRQNDSALITIFSVEKGVIKGKEEYRLDATDEILAEFLKRYYSTRRIPREILINEPCYASEEEKQGLEAYFAKLRSGPVTLMVPQRGDKRSLLELAEMNAKSSVEENAALMDLKSNLNLLRYPQVIEFFDVSNLGHEHIVAGMTRYMDGIPDLKGYRKFKIRAIGQDDFSAMREVVFRRYRRLKREKRNYPDLIIVDGGPGQVSSAEVALRSLGLKIPLIGLAKQQEEIYLPGSQVPIQNDKMSKMMILLRGMRDRTHHFAISYNRKRREMKLRQDVKDVSKTALS